MAHYDSIDTDWDNGGGWAESTSPFLNTLHPITGNLVEYAVRGSGSHSHLYREEIVQKFIYKADGRIRKILEASPTHNPNEFKVENYSQETYAQIAGYAKNVTRIISMYYQTGDEDKWYEDLKCIEGMNVGHLADMLDHVHTAVTEKISPLCGVEEVKQDIHNLVTLMNLFEQEPDSEALPITHVSDATTGFVNPMDIFPPKELENVECIIEVDCQNSEEAERLTKSLAKAGNADIGLSESGGKASLIINPSILGTAEMLSTDAINKVIEPLKKLLAEEGYSQLDVRRDDEGWLVSSWEISDSK